MYEQLTGLIPQMAEEASDEVKQLFINKVQQFVDNHPEFDLIHYQDIMKQNGIDWATESMKSVDVSMLDGQGTMALLVGIYRADYFTGGYNDILDEFFESGCIKRCLLRLNEIDKGQT